MTIERRRRIGVYCASRFGCDPAFAACATAVGYALARREVDVVFGAGRVGLMGALADAALAGGSHVIGVIPEQLADREVAHDGLSDLRTVADMPERKRVMFEAADAFLTLPGGVGTMEELFEVLSWASLGLHPKPIGLLNVNGYYDHLLAFVESMIERGMCAQSVRDLLLDDDDPDRLLDRVLAQEV